MDTIPKTCCYRPLPRSTLLAELMVVMGSVTTAELVKRKPGLRLLLKMCQGEKAYQFLQSGFFSWNVRWMRFHNLWQTFQKKFFCNFLTYTLQLLFTKSGSMGCRPRIVSLDLLTFQNNSVNVVFCKVAGFHGNLTFFLNNHQVLVHLLQETSWCNSNPSAQVTVSIESQLAYGVRMCSLTTWVYSFKEDPQQG